jgi:hypothetical protein
MGLASQDREEIVRATTGIVRAMFGATPRGARRALPDRPVRGGVTASGLPAPT